MNHVLVCRDYKHTKCILFEPDKQNKSLSLHERHPLYCKLMVDEMNMNPPIQFQL